ncbi:hypothetical protein H0H93_012336 [Arthromyces matolae]|nr:hypothetical protein H0H93_012336 [Arthromyces matolae]
MKISIQIAFLTLSLSTLSATAIPIKLDDAVSKEVSNIPHDFDALVRTLYQDEALMLASNVQSSFRELGHSSNAQSISHHLSNLSEYLGWKKRQGITKSVAESLKNTLRSWSDQVKSWRDVPSKDVNHIVAEIATCRNIVDNVLAVSPSPLPDEMNRHLKQLEKILPDNEVLSRRVTSLQALEDFLQYLRSVTNSEIKEKDIVKAKLLTFRDWVEGWDDNELKGKVAALYTIKQCDKIMDGVSNVVNS